MSDYQVTVSLGGVGPSTGQYVVTAYGADQTGVADSTSAFEDAIAAAGAAGGGTVIVPRGSYSATDIDVAVDNVTVEMSGGATITTTSATGSIFVLSGADNFVLRGGKLVGPGKASALSGSYGLEITNSGRCTVEGTEITGFYHGIRSDDSGTAEDGTFNRLYIHDCAFAGIFPKEGDTISLCRFKDIGTTSLHHGLYFNTPTDRGIRLIGNTYEGITGAGIHLNISAAGAINGVTSTAETFDGCGWGIVLSTAHASATITNVNMVGAVINDCVVTDGSTGRGAFFVTSAGSISNCRIQAIISDCAVDGLYANASAVTDSHLDIVVTGCAHYGAYITSDTSTGRIVAHHNTDLGVYMNGVLNSNYDITATANGNSGCYITGTSTDNFIKLHSTGNTGNGIYLGASASANRVVGISSGNSSAQVNNNATNNLSALTGFSPILTAAADDATPSVRMATHLLIPSNTGATAITQLDDSVAGQQVTIVLTNATNPSERRRKEIENGREIYGNGRIDGKPLSRWCWNSR
jgi:hypothetical protein